jgi:hypothetical protein
VVDQGHRILVQVVDQEHRIQYLICVVDQGHHIQ